MGSTIKANAHTTEAAQQRHLNQQLKSVEAKIKKQLDSNNTNLKASLPGQLPQISNDAKDVRMKQVKGPGKNSAKGLEAVQVIIDAAKDVTTDRRWGPTQALQAVARTMLDPGEAPMRVQTAGLPDENGKFESITVSPLSQPQLKMPSAPPDVIAQILDVQPSNRADPPTDFAVRAESLNPDQCTFDNLDGNPMTGGSIRPDSVYCERERQLNSLFGKATAFP